MTRKKFTAARSAIPPPVPLLELKLALLRKSIPQFEAARRLGISETRLSRILCGRIQATNAEQSALADLVGGSIEQFFTSAHRAERKA